MVAGHGAEELDAFEAIEDGTARVSKQEWAAYVQALEDGDDDDGDAPPTMSKADNDAIFSDDDD